MFKMVAKKETNRKDWMRDSESANRSGKRRGWKVFFIICAVIFGIFFLFALFGIGTVSDVTTVQISEGENTAALIRINGPIVTSSIASPFFGTMEASSDWIVAQIKMAEEDTSVEAIIFEINSPGGGALPSKEIVDAIKSTKKPPVSYIREVALREDIG